MNKHSNTPIFLHRWVGQFALVAFAAAGCGGGSGDNNGDNPSVTTTPSPPGISLLTGSIGGPGNIEGIGAAARFNQPGGVAVDATGNVYVADSNNHTIRRITPLGVVTTLAGRAGVAGSDNGIGTAARFDHPSQLASDAAGNVYVADTFGDTIRKITPAGVVTTLAGSTHIDGSADGTGSAARFHNPSGVAVDGAGNVYVSDRQNHTIRKISMTTVVTTLAGTAGAEGSADGTGPAARFRYPGSVAVDATGNVFVVDGNSTLRKITPAGVVTTMLVRGDGVAADRMGNVIVSDGISAISVVAPTGALTTLAGMVGVRGSSDGVSAAASFLNPRGIAADDAGSVYVADTGNHTVRKITPAGVVTTLAGSPGQDAAFYNASAPSLYGVAATAAGDIYLSVGGSSNMGVHRVSPDGVVTPVVDFEGGFGFDGFHLPYPGGVAVDQAANLYAANGLDHTLRRVTPAGIATALAGTDGSVWGPVSGTGFNTNYYAPHSVAVDAVGNVYVASISFAYLRSAIPDTFFSNTILKIGPTGSVTTLAGTAETQGAQDGVGAAASFNQPSGIAVDGAGNVYVADSGNHTIRKITPTGAVTTLAGTAGVRGVADGKGLAASFDSLAGVAVDKAGNVYVTDTSWSNSGDSGVIRKITPSGEVTTVAGQRGSMGIALGSLPGSLSDIRGIAVDAQGVLYVATRAAVLKIQLPQ